MDPVEEQHEIQAEAQSLLSQEDFMFHYENMGFAHGRNATYLCYVVKKNKRPDSSGHLQNFPGGGNHAEMRFLRKFGALFPDLMGYGACGERIQKYSINWFCSWSPCADCSSKLVQFLKQNPNLRLKIFVSRLYYCNREGEREGLRKLKRAGVRIAVMRNRDFKYCWKTFVASNKRRFKPWAELNSNSERLARELRLILQVPAQPCETDDLTDDLTEAFNCLGL